MVDFTDSLAGKIFLAIVGALLSLGATLYVNRRNRLRERRRIIWNVTVDSQSITMPSDIQKQVHVEYSGQFVKDLTTIRLTIENDGLAGIRNHCLRLPAAREASILDFYVTPPPEPEQGYKEVSEPGRTAYERLLEVGYLGPRDTITFLIIASGGNWLDWQPRSSNPTEDIDFQRRELTQQVDDRSHLRPFFFWSIILLFSPIVLDVLPAIHLDYLPSPKAIITTLVFLLFLLPHVAPTSRILAESLTRPIRENFNFSNASISHSAIGPSAVTENLAPNSRP